MIEVGKHETVTEVMVDAVEAETTMLLEPDLDVSCVEVAVMEAVPLPLGVNTPADVTVPPVADQVIAAL